MALRSFGPASNARIAVQCWLAQRGDLGSGPALVDISWNQCLFWLAWVQVTSTYSQLIFIAVEVYSNLLKYLQNYAALSLLAVCSCCLKLSVKSGSPSSPLLFSNPASLKTPLNFFAPLIKTDGEALYKEKCHCSITE